ncbi:MAG TPA: hypothetical protein VMF08_21245 [Candidatus Sulfotelmatobacter sp.]|nr:hypothetical protein [Candidatus Sulfotelmatobacter sp.]
MVATHALGKAISPLPTHAPFGCYPTRIKVQKEDNGLKLFLTDTVPRAYYMVMFRTNAPYCRWLPLVFAIGASNSNVTVVQVRFNDHAKEPVYHTYLYPIQPNMLSRIIFTAGSAGDYDMDRLPDLFEDLVTRTDPLKQFSTNEKVLGTDEDADDEDAPNALPFLDGSKWNVQILRENLPSLSVPRYVLPPSCDARAIRKTIRKIVCMPTKDGFSLSVTHPVKSARYLVLVRDGPDDFWKASGYFTGNTNGEKLLADKNGMLLPTDCTLAMPVITPQFHPILKHPEFIAGSGEDADGDGLPDIYEVLVTKTDPDNPDTGSTGILDGYKTPANDDWTNLEKFRRRYNPFRQYEGPKPVELIEPTLQELGDACPVMRSDLKFEEEFEVRNVKTGGPYRIESFEQLLLTLGTENIRNRNMKAKFTNLEIRITMQAPLKKYRPHEPSLWVRKNMYPYFPLQSDLFFSTASVGKNF